MNDRSDAEPKLAELMHVFWTSQRADLGDGDSDDLAPRASRLRWLAAALLAGYVAFLGAVAVMVRVRQPAGAQPPVRLGQLLEPSQWLADLAWWGFFEFSQFAILALLVTVALPRRTAAETNRSALIRVLSALAVSGGMAVLLCGLRLGRLPDMPVLLVPLFGTVLGVWMGGHCRQGPRSCAWLVPKLAALVLVLAGALGFTAWLATSDAPLDFTPPEVTSDQKRRLVKAIHRGEPQADGTTRHRLSANDANLLLTTAFDHLPLEGKARVEFDEDTAAVDLSLATPPGLPLGRYINCQGVCRLEVDAGELHFEPIRMKVGRLRIPRLLLAPLGTLAVSIVCSDPYFGEALESMERLQLTSQGVEAVYQSEEFREQLVSAIRAHLGEEENVARATAAHFAHLVAAAGDLPGGDKGFAAYLRTAFAFASERSRREDPVVENRAAILALGILLGHRRLEHLVGYVTTRDLRRQASDRVRRIKLRGRSDWARHFLVSAGLAVLSNEAVSDGAGVLKEEIDAGDGGSGFSFADLLADRAGTEFALAATRDPQSARRMQQRLTADFAMEHIFPPAADLPEGISEVELQAEFGGVGGARYQAVLQDIERRLATCPITCGSG